MVLVSRGGRPSTTLLSALILALSSCTPTTGPSPAVAAAALSVESRGGPHVIITINGAEVARVPCDGGVVLRPRSADVPDLPWELRLSRQDGRTVYRTTVADLPRWLVIFDTEARLSSAPVLGPKGPPCASGS